MRRTVLRVAGLMSLAGGSVSAGLAADFVAHAERATARVEDPGPGGRHPILRFTPATGHSGEFVAGVFKAVQTGAALDVLYDPRAPAMTATVDTVSGYGACRS